jgi:class 3 adenylate cyclase
MIDPEARVRELERRLALLEAKERLGREADAVVERAIREKLPLARALDELLPLLAERVGARAVLLHTFDEALALRSFVHGAARFPVDAEALLAGAVNGERCARAARPARVERCEGGATILAEALDVAGESFGCLALAFEGALEPAEREVAAALMSTFAEELDNYLATIARAREKVAITNALSEALRDPVLDEGLDRAIDVLRRHVAFDRLLLVFRHDEARLGRGLHYKLASREGTLHDSRAPRDAEVDALLRARAADLLDGGAEDALERLGLAAGREEVRIGGLGGEPILGRLVLGCARGALHTHDRDLVERFADFLQRRIVDFNKEWKMLSACFPEPTVQRLLHRPGYRERHLAPRERDVAVMFCDISGFTRISEQVLKEPALIGALIDTWSRRVVDIVWDEGGVFDKMVGDCVIGLFGPPFHEWSAGETCRRAAAAARRIRDYTRELPRELPTLRGLDAPIGVATGLNYCPLHVGLFGPDEDYTGFSSGMNNTARLQGVATRDEILCMHRFVEAYDELEAFGEERGAKVKNVAEPLRYRPLR